MENLYPALLVLRGVSVVIKIQPDLQANQLKKYDEITPFAPRMHPRWYLCENDM